MVDVTGENGKVVHWICENNAPSTLVNFGFTAKTFKAGDEVTVVMSAVAKNGTPAGRITRVILADGLCHEFRGEVKCRGVLLPQRLRLRR
jgi:hypothetical protein